MLLVVPNEGKQYWLDVALGNRPAEDLVVRLYSNNYTPVDTSVASNFTAATFAGSGPWTIFVGDFGPATIVANVAQADATPVPTWTHGGGAAQLIYGWYAVTATGGECALAQRFDVPNNMTTGSVESLDPARLKLKSFA